MRTSDHTSSGSGQPTDPTVIMVSDPWNPDRPAVAVTLHPCPTCHAAPGRRHARKCDTDAPCGCGYDLCGECMRIPGPNRHMTVPGINRVRHNERIQP